MRMRRVLLVLCGGILAIALWQTPAHAQAADEAGVFGKLVDKNGTDDAADDQPIVGARITVTQDGTEVGRAETGADGSFEIPLPGEGTYKARLDPDSLPEDVDIDDDATTIELFLRPGQRRILLFDIDAATRTTEGRFDLFLQSLADGTYFGLLLALCAVGLSLIYGTTGLTNFAHGELVTLGALLCFFLNRTVGIQLLAAAPLAVVVAAVAGWLLDAGFWAPLRRRGTGRNSQMVISIGLALTLVNVYLYLFGGITQPFRDYRAQRAWAIGTIDLPPKQAIAGAISLVVLVGVAVALQRTRIGKAMRAIADNPDLASSSGINVPGVIRLVWLFGAGLAALGGILFSISQDVHYEQGASMLLLLFAAITLGGLGAAYGALLGGFVVGLFVTVSAVWIPSELKNVGALVVLIVVLLVRPQGILGKKERIG